MRDERRPAAEGKEKVMDVRQMKRGKVKYLEKKGKKGWKGRWERYKKYMRGRKNGARKNVVGGGNW